VAIRAFSHPALGGLTSEASGTVPVTGQASKGLDSIASHVEGKIHISGLAAPNLGSLAIVAIGRVKAHGSGAAQLEYAEVNAKGRCLISGISKVKLDGLILESSFVGGEIKLFLYRGRIVAGVSGIPRGRVIGGV